MSRRDKAVKEKIQADSLPWLKRKAVVLAIRNLQKQLSMKSWKTSIMGIAALLVAIGSALKALLDGDPTTVVNIDAVIAALAGLGLLAARDNNVTSEQAGAK